MGIYKLFIWLLLTVLFVFQAHTQPNLKIDSNRLLLGETLNYKASWGLLTIGSASTQIDKTSYRIGTNDCFKIDINGQTNGLAKLFYVNDQWTSYIDKKTITTHKSSRSIREGGYVLDEQVRFDHLNKKAEVKVLDKKTGIYNLKKVYDTPDDARDIIAGFMLVRMLDLSKYSVGDTISINGFYEDEGYKINVVSEGKEYVKTDAGKILCYKMNPIVPKNKVFKGDKSVTIWYAADKYQSIIRIRAKMFVGSVQVDIQN